MPSAMKGVVLTSTGEVLATPTPAELANIFSISPKVGLNFAKIFDFTADDKKSLDFSSSDGEDVSPPPSPSSRKEKERLRRGKSDVSNSDACSSSSSSNSAASANRQAPSSAQPPTRLRKPSVRASLTRTATAPVFGGAAKKPASTRTPSAPPPPSSSGNACQAAPSAKQNTVAFPVPAAGGSAPAPEYDMADEENLPSPFLKRVDRERAVVAAAAAAKKTGGTVKGTSAAVTTGTATGAGAGTGTATKKRPSTGNMLRAMAAANNAAGRRGTTPTPANGPSSPTRSSATRAAQIQNESHVVGGRPLVGTARRVSGDVKKTLSRS
ncbi:hypothetical protein AX17_007166 [Amanita inopinata Kibby_2008]|nr:hypothetical protein AX17_007166 [Amanita inopinata Kibby_2008]